MTFVACPSCKTSYDAARLGIKRGEQDQSILFCTVCGAKLLVKIREREDRVQPPRTWRSFWLKPEEVVTRAVHVTVEVLHGG